MVEKMKITESEAMSLFLEENPEHGCYREDLIKIEEQGWHIDFAIKNGFVVDSVNMSKNKIEYV